MTYLITGGAGYLGSHLLELLLSHEYRVIVFDKKPLLGSLSKNSLITFIDGDICDEDSWAKIPKEIRFKGAFHLAALKSVSKSFIHPEDYMYNNVVGTEKFINFCRSRNIKNIVFTSSAAVYSFVSKSDSITIQSEVKPASPYGLSKLQSEFFLSQQVKSNDLKVASMRCFNLAGSSNPSYFDHDGENVVPIILRALTDKLTFTIYGNDLDTPDGSPVRDYIHVADAANAHFLAMLFLEKADLGTFEIYNVSSSKGTSIKELISNFEDLSRKELKIRTQPSRPGEPASVIGDNSITSLMLGWQPSKEISDIVAESWEAVRIREW